ncbi:SEL1-like repeat protein [Moraxella catarrhalis]|nr:SEL1-like repeat protein [Moraxella catarrhalis]
MGAMYYNGQGVSQNKSTAKRYFGQACDNGYQSGCDHYRILNEQGY